MSQIQFGDARFADIDRTLKKNHNLNIFSITLAYYFWYITTIQSPFFNWSCQTENFLFSHYRPIRCRGCNFIANAYQTNEVPCKIHSSSSWSILFNLFSLFIGLRGIYLLQHWLPSHSQQMLLISNF